MNTIKDKVAIVGIGETKYYKRGTAPLPEFRLACEAIIKSAEDAGIAVTDIDGFASYSNDRNDASRLATALGLAASRVLQHGLGRRWWRRIRRGRECCCSGRRWLCQECRGVSRAGAGSIRALRAGGCR